MHLVRLQCISCFVLSLTTFNGYVILTYLAVAYSELTFAIYLLWVKNNLVIKCDYMITQMVECSSKCDLF